MGAGGSAVGVGVAAPAGVGVGDSGVGVAAQPAAAAIAHNTETTIAVVLRLTPALRMFFIHMAYLAPASRSARAAARPPRTNSHIAALTTMNPASITISELR